MTHVWKAEVAVTGVRAISDEEFERVLATVPAVIELNTHNGTLHMTWRFTTSSPDAWDAVGHAGDIWRKAVKLLAGATDPTCTDFRVHRVEEL